MGSVDELMAQIPIGQVAGKLGSSEEQAQLAVGRALPALVTGMAANAQDPAGAASLTKALGDHDSGLLDGGVSLDPVAAADGGLGNVLGGLLGGGKR
jgi:hypothetical protein